MPNNEQDNSRHSRWFWRPGDITIIKNDGLQAENIPDQPKGETGTTDDKTNVDSPAQDDESKGQ